MIPVESTTKKVHKNENFLGFDFEFCTVSLLVMLKYEGFAIFDWAIMGEVGFFRVVLRLRVLGTDPDRNSITWETPSSEAIPHRRKPLGVHASYAAQRKCRYEANKCG
jgi:hypothetical protein